MLVVDCEQGDEVWIKNRLAIPTVSEFSRFITPAKGDLSKQADGYIADLIVESVDGASEHFQSHWMLNGTMTEQESLDYYAFDTGNKVERCGLILNKGAGWSPDGIVKPGAVEAKCPKPSTHVKWLMKGGLPDEHKPQCHGALVVGELEWVDFISYCEGYRALIVRVERDDYTVKVEKALQQFLQTYEAAKMRIAA